MSPPPNPADSNSARRSLPLRLLLSALVLIGAMLLLGALLSATDTALSVWHRLEQIPLGLRLTYTALLLIVGGAAGWLVWRLLRAPRARKRAPEAVNRADLEKRLASPKLRSEDTAALNRELVDLDARRDGALRWIAMFGEISAGKSSLVNALASKQLESTDVTGGTTVTIRHHALELPGLGQVMLADVPGFNEVDGGERVEAARQEALRAHVVLFVVDADLSRDQARQLRWLLEFGKPLLIVLNKVDRYSAPERAALIKRLAEHHPNGLAGLVEARAASSERVLRREADGSEHWVERPLAADISALQTRLRAAIEGDANLEQRREHAVLRGVSQRLGTVEAQRRAEEAEKIVQRYSRRAVVGAVAAVAPGSDIIIQSAVATAMVRELCALYEIPFREIDLDRFLDQAGGRLRTATSISLAVAGNALKAFPGLGTLGGGMMHAVAYGLIFDSVGHAIAATLAERSKLDSETAIEKMDQALSTQLRDRALRLARVALEASSDK